MKRTLCSLLVVSIVTIAVPFKIAAAGSEATKAPAGATSIRAAILKAGPELSSSSPRVTAQAQAQKVPTSLPRSGSDRIRKQGGGHAGMVVGLVTSLVGVAATVYMVKEMKKTNEGTN